MKAALVAVPLLVWAGLTPVPAKAGTGTPTFATYQAPANLFDANNAGEPSIGINGNTGALMYQAFASTYRVRFDDSTTPATATWTDVTAPTSITNIDPILATDWHTGRTFAGGLAGECSLLSYSDNDGSSWTPMTNACTGPFDHETIGAGPYATPALGVVHPHAVYYCAQTTVDACVASYDGGLTFNAPVPVLGGCEGLHGHVKVGPDGTAYVPNASCAGQVGGAITTDNGLTWSSYFIPGTFSPGVGFDPSVTITPDNTLYESWMGTDYHPMVAKSTDHGQTWSTATDLSTTISGGLYASTFNAMVSGDNGRLAVAYLGTQTGAGNPFAAGFKGTWNLYVSYSYDVGTTWTTVQASTDPVQRGCIWDQGGNNACRNLLDFMDANVTPDGRVVVGYADGCMNVCAGPTGSTTSPKSQWATISRQSTGQGLFAAFDTP